MYKERDEDKAERNFKNSKSVSAAYKVVRPRIGLLESREKQKPDDVDFFLKPAIQDVKKKSLESEGILNFKGRFPFH
jgi:CRISPR/Cas system CSM-associated protein Csm2 small subunit